MQAMETKGFFFQFKIILNVLAISSRFIWLPLLWVYVHYKYFNSLILIVFIRQNLTSTDVRFWRIKTVPALKELRSRVGLNGAYTNSAYGVYFKPKKNRITVDSYI